MTAAKKSTATKTPRPIVDCEAVTIRFAGDSGDGMQLAGAQFTHASAIAGNSFNTQPDYPAEIRAPAGTLAGVSGFQVHFGNRPIHTPGDQVDALVAMNPAALQAHLSDVRPGGLLIINRDAFVAAELDKAGYGADPLDDGTLTKYRVIALPINSLNRDALAGFKLSPKEIDRCKNFFALGFTFWVYDRPLEPTLRWIQEKFKQNPGALEANTRTLKAGYHHGETINALPVHYRIAPASIPPGKYRTITGIEALALGLVAGSHQAGLPLVFASYPITPASEVLHRLCDIQGFDIRAVQAEDDVAALSMALGASFGGALGATATSGPGMSAQSEALGLAVMTELPCVIINIQRAGPSTGLPTKTEQADLFQALFGRHGEAPLPVLAASTPGDSFAVTIEAIRLAIRFMTPVVVLSDVYLASGAEPWRIPSLDDLPDLNVSRPYSNGHISTFQPYARDDKNIRPWAVPGSIGLEHRTGGLEKEDLTGNVSYDPLNHERMTSLRARKIAAIADDVPELVVDDPGQARLLILGWGSTQGAIRAAVERIRKKGLKVAHAHLRYLNPLPANLGEILGHYKKILIPELNQGQLHWLIQARYVLPAIGLNKVQGRPFLIEEIERIIEEMLKKKESGVRKRESGVRRRESE